MGAAGVDGVGPPKVVCVGVGVGVGVYSVRARICLHVASASVCVCLCVCVCGCGWKRRVSLNNCFVLLFLYSAVVGLRAYMYVCATVPYIRN